MIMTIFPYMPLDKSKREIRLLKLYGSSISRDSTGNNHILRNLYIPGSSGWHKSQGPYHEKGWHFAGRRDTRGDMCDLVAQPPHGNFCMEDSRFAREPVASSYKAANEPPLYAAFMRSASPHLSKLGYIVRSSCFIPRSSLYHWTTYLLSIRLVLHFSYAYS